MKNEKKQRPIQINAFNINVLFHLQLLTQILQTVEH